MRAEGLRRVGWWRGGSELRLVRPRGVGCPGTCDLLLRDRVSVSQRLTGHTANPHAVGHVTEPPAQVPAADGQQGPAIQGATQGLNLPGDQGQGGL